MTNSKSQSKSGEIVRVRSVRGIDERDYDASFDRQDLARQKMTQAVLDLRVGEVVSYQDIASRAGRPDAPRMAGRVLKESLDTLPWWRVVYSDGRLPQVNPSLQEERLTAEGVTLERCRVVDAPLGRFQKPPCD
ncbi:MAG: MGMT family protein [Planctomycetota bacterium]